MFLARSSDTDTPPSPHTSSLSCPEAPVLLPSKSFSTNLMLLRSGPRARGPKRDKLRRRRGNPLTSTDSTSCCSRSSAGRWFSEPLPSKQRHKGLPPTLCLSASSSSASFDPSSEGTRAAPLSFCPAHAFSSSLRPRRPFHGRQAHVLCTIMHGDFCWSMMGSSLR